MLESPPNGWVVACHLFYLNLLVLFLLFVVSTDEIKSIHMLSLEYSKTVMSLGVFYTEYLWFLQLFLMWHCFHIPHVLDILFIFRCGLATAVRSRTTTFLVLGAYYLECNWRSSELIHCRSWGSSRQLKFSVSFCLWINVIPSFPQPRLEQMILIYFSNILLSYWSCK